MKRRTFLTATATVGAIGAASGATVVSSMYNTINLNILLEEFDAPAKVLLEDLVSAVSENIQELDLDSNFAKKMAMPVQILSNNLTGKEKSISYRNKYNQTITLYTAKNAKHSVTIK
ncbi:MAG: hypothetical protein AAGA77_26170 [Bacteroidota bacterium]